MENEEKIIAYIEKNKWSKSLYFLRKLALQTELEEKVKWGIPTYCYNNKNVFGIVGFKNFFGIWFYNGAFLNDKKKVLINAQEGKTKAMRSWKFSAYESMFAHKKEIKKYLEEAIKNQKEGKVLKPDLKKNKQIKISELLSIAFKKSKKFKTAFDKFSTSKKNEYIEYIESAKREDTKNRRLEKIIPMILDGLSLHDKYR